MKLIGILVLAFAAALVWLYLFTAPTPNAEPAIRMLPTPAHGRKPERLSEQEQQESVRPGQKRAKG